MSILKIVRFLLYAGIVFIIILARCNSFRKVLHIIWSENYYLEDTFFFLINLAIFLIVVFFFTWLVGSSFDNWSMPVMVNFIPILLLAGVLVENGWIFRISPKARLRFTQPIYESTPSDRSIRSMQQLSRYLSTNSCLETSEDDLVNILNQFGGSGYRNHGIERKFYLERLKGDAPVIDLSYRLASLTIKKPGTVFLVCNEETKRFFISGLITEHYPEGALFFVADGVGKPIVITGNY